jgi:hypothetical protein
MPGRRLVLAGCLPLVACSRKYESDALDLAWVPPSGVRLVAETPGPPARAAFEGGIAWYAVPGPAASLDESALQATLQAVADGARASVSGKLVSARVGSLAVGPVARYELSADESRTLAYVIPRSRDTVLLVLSAESASYGRTSANLEASLSTLRWK